MLVFEVTIFGRRERVEESGSEETYGIYVGAGREIYRRNLLQIYGRYFDY
jgi:hypothetical protein